MWHAKTMRFFVPKSSVGRKPFYKLSNKQKKRIDNEIDENKKHANISNEQNSKESHVSKETRTDYAHDFDKFNNFSSFSEVTNNTSHIAHSNSYSTEQDSYPCFENSMLQSHLSQSLINSLDVLDDFSSYENSKLYYDNNDLEQNSSDENEKTRTSFKKELAVCFVQFGFTHIQVNAMLQLLRSHRCFSFIPKDCRTILKTPFKPANIIHVFPGDYIHLGLEEAISIILSCTDSTLIPHTLIIDLFTDGAQGDKSGRIHIWAIQCRITNIKNSKPETLGIFRGPCKPESVIEFFTPLKEELKAIRSQSGIKFQSKILPLKFRAFIADAVARAFVLNHKGHVATYPCHKCKVEGIRSADNRNMIYLNISHPSRTHDEYIARSSDDEHFKSESSPLEELFEDVVQQTPFEYMHLALLGVMKRILLGWIDGIFSWTCKLDTKKIQVISDRLAIIATYCPREFSRPPQPIESFKHFKATEFRLLLFYTGIVALFGIIDYDIYLHFLLFHFAMLCISKRSSSEIHLNCAQECFNNFIESSVALYGDNFVSYNVHGLQHMVSDVRFFGCNIDDISAFPFETNMCFFRKMTRKPHLQLQQIYRRREEQKNFPVTKVRKCKNKLLYKHNTEALSEEFSDFQQFAQYNSEKFTFSTKQPDNCCTTITDKICVIQNILYKTDNVYFVVKFFQKCQYFYDIGLPSSSVDVFLCSDLSNKNDLIHFNMIRSKCFRMPCWKASYSSMSEIFNAQIKNANTNVGNKIQKVFVVIEM